VSFPRLQPVILLTAAFGHIGRFEDHAIQLQRWKTMLIWRGYGILVAFLTVVSYMVVRSSAEHLWGSPLSNEFRPGVELTALLLAAGLVYALHVAINRFSEPRVVIDKSTGQEMHLVSKHDLFFIPVRFWPYILAVLGVVFFFQR
jgi:hypothetical protein